MSAETSNSDVSQATEPPSIVPPAALKTTAPMSNAALSTHGQHPHIEFRFFEELKRRNIVRVGILYVTVCWLVLEPVHVIFFMLDVPQWVDKFVLVVMALGLPVALAVAWAFELTPTGLKPTVLVDPRQSIRRQTGRRLDRAIIVVLVIALVYLLADKYLLMRHDGEREREIAALKPTPAPTPPPAQTSVSVPAPAPPAAAAPAAPMVSVAPPAQRPSPPPVAAVEAPRKPVPLQVPVDPADAKMQGRAVATIVDGQVLFIRGEARFSANEGLRLENGDIVSTGAGAFLQLEFDGGARLELGPQTQLMLSLHDAGTPQRRAIYLLTGWVKVTANPKSTDAFNVLRTTLFELTTGDSVTVTRVAADEASVFVESGTSQLIERGRGGSASELPLKSGQFYTRKPQRTGSVTARPSLMFLGQIPTGFRDTLPSRFDLYRSRAGVAQPATDFTYADVEGWLKSDAPIRRQLAERWQGKAADPAFRRSLEANLRELPEWDPILHPPKEVPEQPSTLPADQSNTTSPKS